MAFKNQLCKEQQEKRFEQERTILVKNYENELQSMIDQQKKQVEKAEEQQHVDLKVIFNRECKLTVLKVCFHVLAFGQNVFVVSAFSKNRSNGNKSSYGKKSSNGNK